MANVGDSIGEVQGLQSENLRSGLNLLYLSIALLKALFCKRVLFSKVKI
jgi:hypothetical protein